MCSLKTVVSEQQINILVLASPKLPEITSTYGIAEINVRS